jgi:hypothetical protein
MVVDDDDFALGDALLVDVEVDGGVGDFVQLDDGTI